MVSPGSALPSAFGSGNESVFVAVMTGVGPTSGTPPPGGRGAGTGRWEKLTEVGGAGSDGGATRAGDAASASGAIWPASMMYVMSAATNALRLRRRGTWVR